MQERSELFFAKITERKGNIQGFVKSLTRSYYEIVMKRKFRDYQEKLIHDLQDPEEAYFYLIEALKDENPRVFLLALKHVLQTQDMAKARRSS